jgi:hypothetical protein
MDRPRYADRPRNRSRHRQHRLHLDPRRKLPREDRERARKVGLSLAMFIRIGLLLSITWVMGLTTPIFTLGKAISGRDLILIIGGLFLIAKSTHEIHEKLEGEEGGGSAKVAASFTAVIVRFSCSISCSRSTPSSRPSAWPSRSRS